MQTGLNRRGERLTRTEVKNDTAKTCEVVIGRTDGNASNCFVCGLPERQSTIEPHVAISKIKIEGNI